MTRVDFYILSEQYAGDRYHLCCRLAEKAWKNGHRVYIHTENQHESAYLDELLWTFNDQSFLPHGTLKQSDRQLNPILIGHDIETLDEHDIMINLAINMPVFFSQFERLLEPLDNNENIRIAGRQRYKYYRDCGYPLNTHEISH